MLLFNTKRYSVINNDIMTLVIFNPNLERSTW